MNMRTIILIIIVAIMAFFAFRSLIRTFTGKGGCSCGHENGDSSCSCCNKNKKK